MITPILKDPRKHGGTLYTFPSASRDLTRAFSNSEYEFAFSHFACLNLPDFRYGTFKDGDLKGVYLNNLHPNSFESINNLNESLKWHLQSYVMNFEIAILNGFSLDSKQYDIENLRTPSERIFFNWLQKVGAIKFSTDSETLDGYGDDLVDIAYDDSLIDESQLISKGNKTKTYRIGNKLYVWKGGEWRSRILVSKTVQYIGIIDMINNVNIDYDSFNEIYLNIPAGVGGSTKVVFNNIFDENYQKGEIIDVDNDIFCTDANYIIGRDPVDLGMTNDKTLAAIYDSTFDPDLGAGSDSDYYLGHYLEHYYKIENGYCINFSDDKYGDGIDKMNMDSEEDFEFNCILIYYKIRKGKDKWVTNLYGVLFLEEVTTSDYNININVDDERAGYIQRYPKFKKGNSWGLKLDLKIDAQPDSQMELREKTYDDPNDGVDMQMFTEALVQLNDCAKLFYGVKKENTDIEERLYKLENIVSGVDTMYDLMDNVGILRNKIEMLQPAINSLEGRMEDVENRISKIENNFGYLISDIKTFEDNVNTRFDKVNDNIIKIGTDVKDLIEKVETEIEVQLGSFNESLNELRNLIGTKSQITNVDGSTLNKIIII